MGQDVAAGAREGTAGARGVGHAGSKTSWVHGGVTCLLNAAKPVRTAARSRCPQSHGPWMVEGIKGC